LDIFIAPEPSLQKAEVRILVVDDVESNRDLLCRRLEKLKFPKLRFRAFRIYSVNNGREALEFLDHTLVDLILLDVMMPEVDGYTTLKLLKQSKRLRMIPVVMLTAVSDFESMVHCIESGAEDYLLKPFNPVILKARIAACLEKKLLLDQENEYLIALQREQARSERLLHNIFPQSIVQQLKDNPQTIADRHADVTVLFADIVGFTELAAAISPENLVTCLNQIFSAFDRLVDAHQVEKIKTVGDAYMAVGGLTKKIYNHTAAIADLALDMRDTIHQITTNYGEPLVLRIGISRGPVVAGVIGSQRLSYDLWGDTVNMASRMEDSGLPGEIQMTSNCGQSLDDRYDLTPRGTIWVKGKGEVETLWLKSKLC
jgi:adenylate cyclase